MMGAVSSKFHRAVILQARPLCQSAGGDCWFDTGTGKHGKLVIEIRGKKRTTPVSCSPHADSGDAVQMKLADVRRILREMAH